MPELRQAGLCGQSRFNAEITLAALVRNRHRLDRDSSGSFATLTAIRRASSRVRRFMV
jgi:hypothetical protein